MKAKLVNESMYPRMTVDEFVAWYEDITTKNPSLPWYNIVSSLENDENSTDGDLYDYFMSQFGIEDHNILNQLLDKREYFMNFEYAQNIDAE
jgi:hypothetical protein